MYEVELKANLYKPEEVIRKLEVLSANSYEEVHYEDVYFAPDDQFIQEEQELRIRKKTHIDTNKVSVVLTYKDRPFDIASKSKPEYEAGLSDFEDGLVLLKQLGFKIDVRFEKWCKNYSIHFQNETIAVTIAEIPQLEHPYMEVECKTKSIRDTGKLLGLLKAFLKEVGIHEEEIDNSYYTELVKKKQNLFKYQ